MTITLDRQINEDIKSDLFHLSTLTRERSFLVFLKDNKVVKKEDNGIGSSTKVVWNKSIEEILLDAQNLQVDEIYFIHNHPNEDERHCQPSDHDIFNKMRVERECTSRIINTRFFVVLGNNMGVYGVPNKLQYTEY